MIKKGARRLERSEYLVIKKRLRRTGLTVLDLSRRFNLPPSTIYNRLSGWSPMPCMMLSEIKHYISQYGKSSAGRYAKGRCAKKQY